MLWAIYHLIETHYNIVRYRKRLIKLKYIYHMHVKNIIVDEKDYTSF